MEFDRIVYHLDGQTGQPLWRYIPLITIRVRRKQADMGRVLVLDTHIRQGIVTVRSLGKCGHLVTSGSPARFNPGGLSKYTSRSISYPSPASRPEAFDSVLKSELEESSYDVVLPVHELTAERVANLRKEIEHLAGLPLPSSGHFTAALDKARTISVANAAGVPTPKTQRIGDSDPIKVASDIGFPMVLKHRRSSEGRDTYICHSQAELEAVWDESVKTAQDWLLQEYVPDGKELAVCTVFDQESHQVTALVQRALRPVPKRRPSTLRKTVKSCQVLDHTHSLLSAMDWVGAANVEFRYDHRDGQWKLLEINPHLWGSLALSVRAGIDVPDILFAIVTEMDPDVRSEYQEGIQCRWLYGDVLLTLARSNLAKGLLEFFDPWGEWANFDVLSLADPIPCVAYAVNGLSSRLSFS